MWLIKPISVEGRKQYHVLLQGDYLQALIRALCTQLLELAATI